MEGEKNYGHDGGLDIKYCSTRAMSLEIVEIGEETEPTTTGSSSSSTRDRGCNDVYVAVGKDDVHVLKWALDHVVSPGARVFLIHVFPPMTFIPTPVGRLAMSQLSKEQVRVYLNEDYNRRKNLLQKYIRLCNDAKVIVDTMLLASNMTAKAIVELIPVLNITNLVMGIKRPPSSRRLSGKVGKGELVKKNAPDYCEVSVVYEGKKVIYGQKETKLIDSSSAPSNRPSGKNFFQCSCFSGNLISN